MALINNPNSWNGGSAVFNSAPITETYLKLAAHREAKNEALDMYHQKQLERVDRDGVRDQDADQFQKKVNDWNQHWQANKDVIRKGNIKAQIDNDKLYGDLLGFVRESKNRGQIDKESMPVALSLKNEMGTYPDQFQQEHEANNLPIGAPGSKKMDLNPYIMKPDNWDVEKGMKQYKDIPLDKTTSFTPTDQNTGLRTPVTLEQFGDKGKQAVAAMAGSDYQNNRSFNQEVRTAVADPEMKKNLEQIYQQQMGKMPEHPEEYATAFILAHKPLSRVEGKPELDREWEAKQQQQREQQNIKLRQTGQVALQAMRATNSRELADYRDKLKNASKEEQNNALDKTMQDLEEQAHKNGEMNLVSKGQTIGKYYTAPVPDVIKGALGKKDEKGKLQYPHEIGYNPDGTIKVIYFKTDDAGNRLPGNKIDNEKSHTITRGEFKAIVGHKLFGVKTTSGADYDRDSDSVENDTDDDEDSVTPVGMSVPKPTAKKKKIPGF